MLEKYKYVGERLHRERLKYGLSLNDLGKAVDLSPSFLSLLENGKTIPSLKVIDKLCSFFSIHIATLFEEEEDHEDFMFIPASKQIEVATENERVLRFLLPKNRACIEPVLVTLHPNSTNLDFTVHKGIEFGYILEGVIEVHVNGNKPVVCREGDSIVYRSSLNHRLVNPTDKVARGLWVGIPTAESISSAGTLNNLSRTS